MLSLSNHQNGTQYFTNRKQPDQEEFSFESTNFQIQKYERKIKLKSSEIFQLKQQQGGYRTYEANVSLSNNQSMQISKQQEQIKIVFQKQLSRKFELELQSKHKEEIEYKNKAIEILKQQLQDLKKTYEQQLLNSGQVEKKFDQETSKLKSEIQNLTKIRITLEFEVEDLNESIKKHILQKNTFKIKCAQHENNSKQLLNLANTFKIQRTAKNQKIKELQFEISRLKQNILEHEKQYNYLYQEYKEKEKEFEYQLEQYKQKNHQLEVSIQHHQKYESNKKKQFDKLNDIIQQLKQKLNELQNSNARQNSSKKDFKYGTTFTKTNNKPINEQLANSNYYLLKTNQRLRSSPSPQQFRMINLRNTKIEQKKFYNNDRSNEKELRKNLSKNKLKYTTTRDFNKTIQRLPQQIPKTVKEVNEKQSETDFSKMQYQSYIMRLMTKLDRNQQDLKTKNQEVIDLNKRIQLISRRTNNKSIEKDFNSLYQENQRLKNRIRFLDEVLRKTQNQISEKNQKINNLFIINMNKDQELEKLKSELIASRQAPFSKNKQSKRSLHENTQNHQIEYLISEVNYFKKQLDIQNQINQDLKKDIDKFYKECNRTSFTKQNDLNAKYLQLTRLYEDSQNQSHKKTQQIIKLKQQLYKLTYNTSKYQGSPSKFNDTKNWTMQSPVNRFNTRVTTQEAQKMMSPKKKKILIKLTPAKIQSTKLYDIRYKNLSIYHILGIFKEIFDKMLKRIKQNNYQIIHPDSIYIDNTNSQKDYQISIFQNQINVNSLKKYSSPETLLYNTKNQKTVAWNIGIIIDEFLHKSSFFKTQKEIIDQRRKYVFENKKYPQLKEITEGLLQKKMENRKTIPQCKTIIIYQMGQLEININE